MSKLRCVVNLFLVSLLLGLCACASDSLIFTTYTKVGLDISATNQVPTQANFGYKRFEGAIIPVDIENSTAVESTADEESKLPSDAKSVYAEVFVKNSWVQGLTIKQRFATGAAADKAANTPDAP